MGRPLRLQSSNLDYSITVECNAPSFGFETEEDFTRYLELLQQIRQRHALQIFSYVLLPDRVELFLRPGRRFPLARTMQWLNWTFALDHNRRKRRQGSFWIRRYYSLPVESGRTSLALMGQLANSPRKAGLVESPENWNWSAHPTLISGSSADLLTLHPAFLKLAEAPEERLQKYQEIVAREGETPKQNPRRGFVGSPAFGRRIAKQQKSENASTAC